MSVPLLEDLLREDGHNLTRSGNELECCCPFHEEKKPSFSMNPAKQIYFCHGCGAKGGVYTYLTEKRGMSKKDAYETAGLGDGSTKPQGAALPAKTPYLWQWDKLRSAPHFVCHHEYKDKDDKLLFIVIRSDKEKWNAMKPGDEQWARKFAKCRAFHKAEQDGQRGWLARHPMKENRPLYRLKALLESAPEKQVMLVEGEKCADTVARFMPMVTVTTWPGGSKAIALADWSPLKGRKVMIMADADTGGRKAARQIAEKIHGQCDGIKLVLPSGDSTDDIHDWLVKGGPKLAIEKIKELVKDYEPPKAVELTPEAVSKLDDNKYYTVLGNIHNSIAVMLSTHRILTFSRSSMTSPSTLIAMADFHWWCNQLQAQALAPAACQPVGSALIRIADQKGQIDMTKMTGRGFYRTLKGRYVWHLGDRLLSNGKEMGLGALKDEMVALSGPPMTLHKDCASMDERTRVADAVLRYRWQRNEDCKAFMGWIVASLVGGALEWRPHVWMSGQAETGKSWIMKNVAEKVFGDSCVKLADATPAAVSRRMGSDSLPMLLDEAEPDRQWIDGIMDVIRISAGADGERIRADQADSVQSFQPRFSAMLSSIKVAQMSGGNASRFVIIEFGPPVADWPSVQAAIEGSMDGTGARIRAAIMRDGQEIVENAERIRKAVVSTGKIGTRPALIYSALSAGWQWWTGKSELVLPDYKQQVTGSSAEDAPNMLRDILGLRMRTSDNRDVSVMQLLEDDSKSPLCVDYGIRRDNDGLLIAAAHASLKQRLERTRWRGVDPERMLLQIDGATKSNNAMWFGALRHRCVQIPEASCAKMGVQFTGSQTDLEGVI